MNCISIYVFFFYLKEKKTFKILKRIRIRKVNEENRCYFYFFFKLHIRDMMSGKIILI